MLLKDVHQNVGFQETGLAVPGKMHLRREHIDRLVSVS